MKMFRLLLSPKFQKLCYFGAMALSLSIIVIGSLPGARSDIGQYASGWLLHAAAYAVLAVLVYIGSSGNESWRAIKTVLTIAAMGAADEYVQSFFPYRTGAVSDWLIDTTAGLAVSATLWRYWPRICHQSD